ncbi:MAG: PIG-L family deacetylase, partial [Chitinophagales bacterium]
MYNSKGIHNQIHLGAVFVSLLLFFSNISAQNTSWDAARILLEIEKLNTTGSVLYIAAHPDDENTRMITYLANEKKVRTAYLSLTRGDGGQNLLGEEQGAYLGLIRTQELLEARKTDGGEQFFTTAVDFGYTKTADETFSIWNQERLLEEVVWIIRSFRPDIIITRFPPDARAGHGQHTVSAIIAQEAFKAASDPERFPAQLAFVKPWQTQRIFWNTSLRWDTTLEDRIKAGSKVAMIDVGLFNPLLGKSYGEIAAHSRTHHKSQGFGSTPVRGEVIEYLELSDGENFETDIFENINTTWERYRRGSQLSFMLHAIIEEFDVRNPALSIPKLLALRTELFNFPEDAEIRYKKEQLDNIILACAGAWFQPVAVTDMITAGEKLQIVNNAIVRNNFDIQLLSVEVNDRVITYNRLLEHNVQFTDSLQVVVPANANSTPYWLQDVYDGFFTVHDKALIGRPENDPAIVFKYNIQVGDQTLHIKRGVVYKETDAVKGEVEKPLAIVPALTVNFNEDIFVFGKQSKRKIVATIRAGQDLEFAALQLQMPEGWSAEPQIMELKLNKDEAKQVEFSIQPLVH